MATAEDFENHRYGVAKGWQPLIEKLHADLNEVNPDYELQQVKEKWGGLRYYVGYSLTPSSEPDKKMSETDKKMQELIQAAESASFDICEVCGEPGEIRNTGYVKTLCDNHHAEREATRAANYRPSPDVVQ